MTMGKKWAAALKMHFKAFVEQTTSIPKRPLSHVLYFCLCKGVKRSQLGNGATRETERVSIAVRYHSPNSAFESAFRRVLSGRPNSPIAPLTPAAESTEPSSDFLM